MSKSLTARGTSSKHYVSNPCRSIGQLPADRRSCHKTRPKPRPSQFSQRAMAARWLGGGNPCLADELSAIGWNHVALTATDPEIRRGGHWRGDVVVAVAKRDGKCSRGGNGREDNSHS
jgi:hypothetical protein